MNLSEKLHADIPVVTAWSGVPDALTVEIVANQAFDAVTLDMQHGGHSDESVLRCPVPVLRANKHAIVRVPVGRFDMASRALDFGAEAVIAPMINSVSDAKAFAASMKYPPTGERSWGPTFAFSRMGGTDHADWLANANARTLSIAMVETRQALDCLDGIVETPGIDAIFVGPADFSIAWSHGKSVNAVAEDMMETVESIAVRAKQAGKVAGIYVVDWTMTGRFKQMGFNLFAGAAEGALIAAGAASMLSAARKSLGR